MRPRSCYCYLLAIERSNREVQAESKEKHLKIQVLLTLKVPTACQRNVVKKKKETIHYRTRSEDSPETRRLSLHHYSFSPTFKYSINCCSFN